MTRVVPHTTAPHQTCGRTCRQRPALLRLLSPPPPARFKRGPLRAVSWAGRSRRQRLGHRRGPHPANANFEFARIQQGRFGRADLENAITLPSISQRRWRARFLFLGRQPQNHVAVALSRSAHSPETVDHVGRQPDESLAALVDVILVAHAAERKRGAERLERFDADRTELARSG